MLTATIDVSGCCDLGVHCFVFVGVLAYLAHSPYFLLASLLFLSFRYTLDCRPSAGRQSIQLVETVHPRERVDLKVTLSGPDSHSAQPLFESLARLYTDYCRTCASQVVYHIATLNPHDYVAIGS